MYKLLLTWRYLLTRYIALVCVVSVTLGVATLIVVNAVMLGFSHEMENKIHGVLSDVMIGSRSSLRGFDDVDQRVRDVWKVAGDMIEAVTPTVTTMGLLSFEIPGNETSTHYVQVVGIDPETYAQVTSISQFLQHPKHRDHLTFNLEESGYDSQNPRFGKNATQRLLLTEAGWVERRKDAKYEKFRLEEIERQREIFNKISKPQSDSDPFVSSGESDSSPVSSEAFDAGLSADPNDPLGLKKRNDPSRSSFPSPISSDASRSGEDVADEKSSSSSQAGDPYAAALQNLPTLPDYSEPNETPSDPENSSPPFPVAPTNDFPEISVDFPAPSNNFPTNPSDSSASSNNFPTNPSDSSAPSNNFPTNPSDFPASPNVPSRSSDSPNLADSSDSVLPNPVLSSSPLDDYEEYRPKFNKETQQDTGIILGMRIVSGLRRRVLDPETNREVFRESLMALPGDDVTLSLYATGTEKSFQALMSGIVSDRFTIVDLYECQMADVDESYVYVPIDKLQELRKMVADDGTRLATNILIKAKPGVNIAELRDRLQESEEFPTQLYKIETWRDNQSTILSAVAIERSILNVLLFMIIAVAGFGILAIFFMIVVEKTKDIGIMKSLGASGTGVMQIFLFYGLALGLVGSGFGLVLGLTIVNHINGIAAFLSKIMGHEVFDPSVYNFQEVPAIVEPATVVWIMIGSILIAVLSGVLPAIRAAKLKPVDALRV